VEDGKEMEMTGAKREDKEYISYEDFLALCDEDTLAEWVNGKIELASIGCASRFGWLTSVLRIYVEVNKLGIIRSAPFQMKTGPDLPGRAPDIIFLSDENRDKLKKTYLDGPADLVIEIISEESLLRDRGEKFAEYEIGGVKEYWILDPETKRADFFILKEGRYERRVEDAHGIYYSEIIEGLWLKVAWLWNLPPVLDVLKELGVI